MQRKPRVAAIIVKGDEYMHLYSDGAVARPAINMPPSGEWRITGAVTLNNFGGVVRRYSLAEILADPKSIPWQFKNGNQRTHVQDLDHGTRRQWNSPTHYIY